MTTIEANNDEVICPNCVTQFRAIPVNVQAEINELRAELAALKQQEPVAYWIPKAEQFCIANPDGRPFVKAWGPLYLAAGAQEYDQQALELCDKCGWKAVIPGEPCLVCERNAKMLTAGAQERKPGTCQWTPEDDDNMPGTYATSCGELWSFIDGGPVENNCKFCHGCGQPVEVKVQP